MKLALLGASASGLGTLAVGAFFLFVVASLFPTLAGNLVGPSASGYEALATAPPVVPRLAVATQAQEQFAGELVAGCTHHDPIVDLAWTLAEGGGVNPGQPAFNFLFLTAVGGGFRSFSSIEEAATAVCLTLGGSDYRGILVAASLPPVFQVMAIAQSPWDGGHVPWGDPAGHYGGQGQNLLATYYGLLGTAYCPNQRGPC